MILLNFLPPRFLSLCLLLYYALYPCSLCDSESMQYAYIMYALSLIDQRKIHSRTFAQKCCIFENYFHGIFNKYGTKWIRNGLLHAEQETRFKMRINIEYNRKKREEKRMMWFKMYVLPEKNSNSNSNKCPYNMFDFIQSCKSAFTN